MHGLDKNMAFHLSDIYQFGVFIDIFAYFSNLFTIIFSVIIFTCCSYKNYKKEDMRRRSHPEGVAADDNA